MGAIIETPSIYLDMTAEENLKIQYRILGLPSFDGLNDILKITGLEHTGKKKVKNFSLGMRQRLGIAAALAGDPEFPHIGRTGQRTGSPGNYQDT